jgi:predicted RNase H-like nuclease (RuvC/YqgF family)
MKKLTLVMVFVLLTALLIGFNYLLLDRESKEQTIKNLEYVSASNNSSISAQKREISALEDENSALQNELNKIKQENERLTKAIDAANLEKDDTHEKLQDKIDYINNIKQFLDLEAFSKPFVDYVDALNQGDYSKAYELEFAGVPIKDRTISSNEYTQEMKNAAPKIDIVEVKLDTQRGSGTGEIYLATKFAVKLSEQADKTFSRFSDGENVVYVNIGYSNGELIIQSINRY